MKLKYECGRVLIIPETPQEGMHVGAFFGSLPEQTRPSVWMNERQDHMDIDAVMLNTVDVELGWRETGGGRIDRIRELLEIEDRVKKFGIRDVPPLNLPVVGPAGG